MTKTTLSAEDREILTIENEIHRLNAIKDRIPSGNTEAEEKIHEKMMNIWNSLLYDQMLKASIWGEIEIRMPDDDSEFEEVFGFSRESIEAAKESIIEELLPDFQDLSEDRIFDTIKKFC